MGARSLQFNEEHNVLRQAVRRWLNENVVPHHEAWDEAGIVPRDIWRKFGEQGFLCPWVPEAYGGMDADFLTSVVILEELRGVRVGDGRALAEVAQHRRRRDGPGRGVRWQLRLRLHPEREASARALVILSPA